MSFADADRLLRRAVLRGRVRVRQDGDLDADDIPTSEWPRLAWEKASNGEVHEFVRLLRDGVPCYENPVLVAEEVRVWLQALAAAPMDRADRDDPETSAPTSLSVEIAESLKNSQVKDSQVLRNSADHSLSSTLARKKERKR